MRKIIFVHLLNDYSGSPKVLSQAIKTCSSKGYEVELYTGKSEKGFLSDLIDNQHHYYYKWFNNRYLTLLSFLLSQSILFFKLFKHRNEDVIFYINTMLPFGAALAGKLMNKPIYYHIHETYVQPKIFKQFLRYMIQKTATKVIFVSKYLKSKEYFERKSEFVIYNALPQKFMEKAKRSKYFPIKNGRFNVLMICSLKSYKGLDEFIKIAKQCESFKQLRFTLILNEKRIAIDAYFKSVKIPLNVTLESSQSEVIKYYENSSLVLNLSKVDKVIETFGLTILEAMAFGIPVIVPPIGGPAELVTDDVEGYLISSCEVEIIAQRIIELSTNQSKCLKFSKQARKRALDFDESSFNKNVIESIHA